MTLQLRVFAIITSVAILFFIIELVRRRRLREEHSWVWLLAGALMLGLTLSYDFLLLPAGAFFGGILPSAILFLFAILFLVLINIHFSVTISRLTSHVKELAQEIAILRAEKPPSRSD